MSVDHFYEVELSHIDSVINRLKLFVCLFECVFFIILSWDIIVSSQILVSVYGL